MKASCHRSRRGAEDRRSELLRQGKLDGAIEQYVRLVEEQPRDWNSINTLGDLYVRAGDTERAVVQYVRIADHLFEEGFFPRPQRSTRRRSRSAAITSTRCFGCLRSPPTRACSPTPSSTSAS